MHRWVLQQQGVTSVVVGARLGKASTQKHLRENAKVLCVCVVCVCVCVCIVCVCVCVCTHTHTHTH